jgi:hypothetical protein
VLGIATDRAHDKAFLLSEWFFEAHGFWPGARMGLLCPGARVRLAGPNSFLLDGPTTVFVQPGKIKLS